MTGKTHRVGGMLACLGGYLILQEKGMLISNVEPILQLTVMYPFAIYGSICSDLDHNKNSAPSKDVVSLGINKVLHLTTKTRKLMEEKGLNKTPFYKALGLFDASHRSWQTHSDLFLALMIYLFFVINSNTTTNGVILSLIGTGLILGIISHLLLDMITPEGVWSLVFCTANKISRCNFLPKKIHLVPNIPFFRTGGKWEDWIRYLMWFIVIILFGIIILQMIPVGVYSWLNLF